MRLGQFAATVDSPSARRHPISRWYVGPAAERLVRWIAPSWVRPVHLTLAGLGMAALAIVVLGGWPTAGPIAAMLVLLSWFFDRADGLLARRQQTASAWGAWLDANVDELIDVGLQIAVASAAARLTGSQLPWFLLVAFLGGKYLFFHGLQEPQGMSTTSVDMAPTKQGLLRRLYHLPGNTDIRVHLLVVALLTGFLTTELALVATYYNFRWIARYVLVARRLGGPQ